MDEHTLWLNDDEIRVFLAVIGLAEALPALLSAQLKKAASINNFEYMVLAGLSESPDRCAPMTELAAFANGSISRLSHALTRLEKRGWVRRFARRGTGGHLSVVLTDVGMDVVRRVAPGYVREVRKVLIDRLSSEHLIEFGRSAERILELANPDAHRIIVELYPTSPG